MSLFDDASLVLIPDGAKDGTLYSVKPTDGTGDFTFTRGSNLAATRVDENGLIEKGRENLLLRSNTFSTTWSAINTSVTSGQSGYDGSSDAWLLSKFAAFGRIQQSIATGDVQTLSIYAKAGSLNWLRLQMTTSSTFDMYYDLQNGVLGSSQINAPIDATITSVGNGWYRCSITTIETLINVRVYPADDDNDLSGTSGNIYIQDAQLEAGLVATDYIETGATTAQAGILEDLPRIDYSGGASCPALLLEPQRTNLVTQSEYFGSSDWTKTNVSVTSNAAISPQGVSNATEIIENSSTAQRFVADSLSLTSGTSYSVSVYAKKNTRSVLQISPSVSHIAASYANYDLENGVVSASGGSVAASIEDVGSGWYRCVLTFTPTNTATATLAFFMQTSTTALRGAFYAGDGSSSLYLYGAQVEEGSYPTSYIPTYGTSVTRGADECVKTGISSLIGQTEGVLFVEFEFNKDIDSAYRISLSDGTTSNRIQLGTYGDQIQVYVQTGGATQVYELAGTLSVGTTYKAALAYKANDYVCYLNGSQLFTDTSASVPACSKLGYEIPDTTGLFEHPIKQQLLFPTRLSNTELAALTSL